MEIYYSTDCAKRRAQTGGIHGKQTFFKINRISKRENNNRSLCNNLLKLVSLFLLVETDCGTRDCK
jgi:hypothetical protein